MGVGVLPALLAWLWGAFFRLRRWPACCAPRRLLGVQTPAAGSVALGPGCMELFKQGVSRRPRWAASTHEVGLTHRHLSTEASGL